MSKELALSGALDADTASTFLVSSGTTGDATEEEGAFKRGGISVVEREADVLDKGSIGFVLDITGGVDDLGDNVSIIVKWE